MALAVAGLRFTRYLPDVGGSHFPPMKLSYLDSTVTMLPVSPGGTYLIVHPFQLLGQARDGTHVTSRDTCQL